MTSPAPADWLAAGVRLLDRFTILREIGRGGFSIVYAARDDLIGGEVALKLLVPPPAVAQQAKERMRREVRAVRELSHRSIVRVYDFVEDGPRSFVVMELINGRDLAIRVRDKGPVPGDEAGRIGAQVAEALSLAHTQGILHRDVKPSNILLAADGRACLTDFGSAKVQGMVSMTQTGGLPGTLDFIAPELLAGSRADARSDLYALGLTLHVAVTGQLPKRSSPHLPPPAAPDGHHPRSLRTGIPEWLDAIVARATAARPSDRYASAELMADALIAREAVVGRAVRVSQAGDEKCRECESQDAGPAGVCRACQLSRRWIPLPFGLYAVAGGMVGAGIAASAFATLPLLMVVSPVLAAGLVAEGQRQARGRWRLPWSVRQRVARVMADLSPGAARGLLLDIVLATDAVYAPLLRLEGQRASAEIADFLGAAAGAARELAEADELLATLEHGRDGRPDAPGEWQDAMATTERRRDALVQRMLGTMAGLVRMAHHAGRAGGSSSELMGELGRGLEAAVSDHAAAMREVEAALKPVPA